MRRIALIAVASLLAAAPSAAADATATATATPAKPGQPSTLHFDINGLAAPISGRLPKTLQLTAPRGVRVNLKAIAKRCSNESAKLNECPAASLIGKGQAGRRSHPAGQGLPSGQYPADGVSALEQQHPCRGAGARVAGGSRDAEHPRWPGRPFRSAAGGAALRRRLLHAQPDHHEPRRHAGAQEGQAQNEADDDPEPVDVQWKLALVRRADVPRRHPHAADPHSDRVLQVSRIVRLARRVMLPTGLTILGVVTASPAAAAPRACPLSSISGAQVGGVNGDPGTTYSVLGGSYAKVPGIAYKLTGQFPHATALTLLAIDDYTFIPGSPGVPPSAAPPAAYTLADFQIRPDSGSVNPFRPGNAINAPHRKYTIWVWPDSIAVPAGLRNVLLYPTTPAAPFDFQARWSVVLRQYLTQPGYSARRSLPTVNAVRTSRPNVDIPCPASITPRAEQSALAWSGLANAARFYLPALLRPTVPVNPAAPPDSRSVYFTRAPSQFVGVPDGLPVNGANDALNATLDLSKVTVVTIHKTPTFFNNQHLRRKAVMRNYQVRYMSVVAGAATSVGTNALPDTSAIFTRHRSWVTVMLPSAPRLTAEQEQEVRAKAAALRYNVLQDPPPRLSRATLSTIVIRQKIVNGNFCCAVTKVPSWTDPSNPATAKNDYRDWLHQNSPAFFANYASNPRNMGAYWIGGVQESFSEFMAG